MLITGGTGLYAFGGEAVNRWKVFLCAPNEPAGPPRLVAFACRSNRGRCPYLTGHPPSQRRV